MHGLPQLAETGSASPLTIRAAAASFMRRGATDAACPPAPPGPTSSRLSHTSFHTQPSPPPLAPPPQDSPTPHSTHNCPCPPLPHLPKTLPHLIPHTTVPALPGPTSPRLSHTSFHKQPSLPPSGACVCVCMVGRHGRVEQARRHAVATHRGAAGRNGGTTGVDV
eukprot:357442-Chlamydomonas_euryale.AAC.9